MQIKQTRTAFALALVAACIAALGSLAGPVSSASASTWHHRWSYLHFPANPRVQLPCVPTRRIYLAAGRYRWRIFSYHWAHPKHPSDNTRVVRLARGWYRWDDCLGHFLHHVGEPDYIYRLRSTLRRLATGGRVYNDKAWEDGSFGDGSYHWGSTLDRIR